MVRARELIALHEARGFVRVRQSGSHVVLRHADGRRVTVPFHGGQDVRRGLLAKILQDAGLTIEDLTERG